MKSRTTVQIGVLAVILGCALYSLDEYMDRRQASRVQVNRVFDVTTDPVTAVGCERDGLRMECVRKGAHWFLQSPMRARANTPAVERIVAALETLKWKDYISPEHREERNLTLEDYGLAPSAMRIMLETEGRREVLHLGDRAPFGDEIYGRMSRSEAVFTLPGALTALFPEDLSLLRDRSVLYGDPHKTERIDIHRRAAGFLQLVRHKTGWMLQQPVEARADAAAVRRLLEAVYGMRVIGFRWDAEVDDSADSETLSRQEMALRAQIETAGLAPDAARIRLAVWTEGDRLGQEAVLGRAADGTGREVYARRGGVDAVYTVSADVVEACMIDADLLRDRAVLNAAAEEIGTLVLRHGEERIELQRRRRGGWRIVNPVQWEADTVVVDALVARLLDLRVARYLPLPGPQEAAQVELDPPRLEIAMGLMPPPGAAADEGMPAPPDRLRLMLGAWTEDGGGRYARTGHRDELLVLPPDGQATLDTSLLDPLLFRERVMLAVAPETVFRLQAVSARAAVVLDRDAALPDAWRSPEDAGAVVDTNAVARVLATMSRLEAAEFVAFQPASLAAYGLEPPSAVVTLGLRGADGIQKVLMLGRPDVSGRMHAMIQGHAIVFLIEARDAAILMQPLHAAPAASAAPGAGMPPPGERADSIGDAGTVPGNGER